MARKTNKTDHVLNLLSAGAKKSDSKREEKDTPPVDLRKKDLPAELEDMMLDEPDTSQEMPDEEDMSMDAPQPRENLIKPSPVEKMQEAAPKVSVVRTSAEENPIADAVKESLEAEYNAYIKEKNDEKNSDFFIELQNNSSEDLISEPEEPEDVHYADLEMREASDSEKPKSESSPSRADSLSSAVDDLEKLRSELLGKRQATVEELVSAQKEKTEEPMPVDVKAAMSHMFEELKNESGEAEETMEADIPTDLETASEELMEALESFEESMEAAALEPELESMQEPETGPEPTVTEAPQHIAGPPEGPQLVKVPPEALQNLEEPTDKSAEDSVEEEQETETEAEEGTMSEPAEKDYTMVNVMEYLVRDQVPKYVRQFGHCDCDRCLEDTVALTLTHLPAKYVVVNKNAVSPLLNFYEKRYAGQLIVEITKATMIVNESPNH